LTEHYHLLQIRTEHYGMENVRLKLLRLYRDALSAKCQNIPYCLRHREGRSSETSTNVSQTTRCHIPEDNILNVLFKLICTHHLILFG